MDREYLFAYPELMEQMAVEGALVGVIALGYAAETSGERPRKSLEEIVGYR